MKILIACEYSGRVRDAFTKKGHDAISCDILPTDSLGPHILGDVIPQLKLKWDMIIAFPPCTHIACSGAKHFAKKRIDGRQQQGISFFLEFTKTNCKKVIIENPVGIMSTIYRKPDQIIQPYMFGDQAQKTTCLWLKGVPKLTHTDIVEKGSFYISPRGKKIPKWYSDNKSGKIRSLTFQGIANAMANQWGQ